MIRLIDLLAVAVEDMRQGGDPRLPLELALVKVTRPGRRPLARVDRVPARAARAARPPPASQAARPRAAAAPPAAPEPARAAARRASRRRSSSSSSRRRGSGRSCRPSRAVDPDRVGAARGAAGDARRRHAHVEFPADGRVPSPARPRSPKNATLLRGGALRGDRPGLASRSPRRERRRDRARPRRSSRRPRTSIYELVKETFDAREVEEADDGDGPEQAHAAGCRQMQARPRRCRRSSRARSSSRAPPAAGW